MITENPSVDDEFQQALEEKLFSRNFTDYDLMNFIAESGPNHHLIKPSTEVCLIVAYVLVMVLGIVGNLLVCYVVYRNKQLWYPLNFLIVNLAICDVFQSFSLPFTMNKLILRFWSLGNVMCKITSAMQTLVTFVSTFTIVSIAIERYRVIVVDRKRSTPNSDLLLSNILAIWGISLCLSIPMFVYHRVDKREIIPALLVYEVCIESWSSYVVRAVYTTCVVLIQYVLPLILISVMHCQIYNFLRQQIVKKFVYDKRTMKIYRRNKRNLILLTTITMTFAITWLPVTILNVLVDLDYRIFGGGNFNLIYSVCLLIAISSVSINPIVYGLLNSKFRSALSDLYPFHVL